MATTIKWPGTQYSETLSASGAFTVLGLDRHVNGLSISVDPASSGTYFVLVTDSSVAAIEADTVKWHDVFGDGITPQSVARATSIDSGEWTALCVSKESGATGSVAFSVKVRRQ